MNAGEKKKSFVKDQFFARFTLSGVAAPPCGGQRYFFTETADVKNALAVWDGAAVQGYLLGSEAAFIKACLCRGLHLYCLFAGAKETAEDGECAPFFVNIYLTPKRI